MNNEQSRPSALSDEKIIEWIEETCAAYCINRPFAIIDSLCGRVLPAPVSEPIGYLSAEELSRIRSGHAANMRSAKFGPSELDSDVPVYLSPPQAVVAQPVDELREVVAHTAKVIRRQLDLIADRAKGDFLDKRPVVLSLTMHAVRLEKALAQIPTS